MPRLSPLGVSACGVGNITLSIDGATPPALAGILGGGADWLTATQMVFQDNADVTLKVYTTTTGLVTPLAGVVAGGANILHAGGGVVAAWRDGYGAYTNVSGFGPFSSGASGGVSEEGDVVLITNTHVGRGLDSYTAAGVKRVSLDVPLGLQQPIPVRTGYFAYADTSLTWQVRTVDGTVVPTFARPGVNWTIPVPLMNGTVALVERTELLSIRLKDSAIGFYLSAPLSEGFNPDAMEISPGVVRINWATDAGDSRVTLQVQDVNVVTGENRLATVDGTSLKWVTQAALAPVNLVSGLPTLKKWVGWYYSSGRYGDYRPTQNCTVLSIDNYKDGSGTLPPGAADTMRGAAVAAGAIFCSGNQEDIDVMKSRWDLVAGLVTGEGDAMSLSAQAATFRANLALNGLPSKPIIATLRPGQLTAGWQAPTGVDAYAPEIYFDTPAGSYAAQYAATQTAIAQVVAAAAGTPIYLIAQAYDRGNPAWVAAVDQIAAIIDACGDALLADQ
ncbi:MAG TPA: hypothetical protein VN903_31180 [Polyangia bacterium]|nr:hypothetical protein [Polyangia bacterium]